MGMHFGLIAAKASLPEFRAAFSETWPELEVVASADCFQDADEIHSWMSVNSRPVSASKWRKDNRGSEAYVFCKDGAWAVLLDFSYVLAGDEAALQKLSARFGSVLSFIVETTTGCAYFHGYEAGRTRRMILSVDGEIESTGDPLPEEAGIGEGTYYMDETERLMQAFGLSLPEDLPEVSTAVAIAVVDQTDYTPLSRSGKAMSPSRRTKPWWKFW